MNPFLNLSETERRVEATPRVLQLVAAFSGHDEQSVSLQTDVVVDLGIAGDDGYDLLLDVQKNFGTDFSEMNRKAILGQEVGLRAILLIMAYGLLLALVRLLRWRAAEPKLRAIYSKFYPEKRQFPVSRLVEAVVAGRWS